MSLIKGCLTTTLIILQKHYEFISIGKKKFNL